MSMHTSAVSDVGVIRKSNQDSGYAGTYLSVVADGMGGHAGGDVASHVVIRHMLQLDKQYPDVDTAQQDMLATLLQANDMLADVVDEHPELAGLGTTVSAMLRVNDRVVIAHIGDSRIYLLREGSLSQVTVDHTFVQRLIDSGKITEEEAHDHPRRSVLMRVLGDVDALPEIDTAVLDTQVGDRWMLCSDGLTGVVDKGVIIETLTASSSAEAAARALVDHSVEGGAPDNVTVVVTDISNEPDTVSLLVGSAGSEIPFSVPLVRETSSEAAKKSRPKPQPLPVSTGGMNIPAGLTAQLDAVKARRIRRRFVLAGALILVLGAILISGILGYRWTQTQYYVGLDADTVVIYQGVSQNVLGISLSTPYIDTEIPRDALTVYEQEQLSDGIAFGTLGEAQELVDSLSAEQQP
jgi:serine/threonine protein phosphatase PrpC